MCGFVGFAGFKDNFRDSKVLIKKMNEALSKRGPDEEGYYIDDNIAMGHKRLIVIDPNRRETTDDSRIFFW